MLSDAAIPGAPPLRFCPDCGGALAADAPACAPCAERPPRSVAVGDHLAPIRRVLTLYFSLLALAVVMLLTALAVRHGSDRWFATLDFAWTAGCTLIIIFAAVAGGSTLLPILRTRGPVLWYAAAPVISLGTFAVASGVVYLAGLVFGWTRSADLPLQNAGLPWWTPILLVAIQPGIFEELAFRGLIQSWLGQVLGRRETLVVSAFLFATIHLNPVQFVHVLIMGIVLGLLRQRTGSLYPGMIAHACHNGLVLLSAAMLEGIP